MKKKLRDVLIIFAISLTALLMMSSCGGCFNCSCGGCIPAILIGSTDGYGSGCAIKWCGRTSGIVGSDDGFSLLMCADS